VSESDIFDYEKERISFSLKLRKGKEALDDRVNHIKSRSREQHTKYENITVRT